MTEEGRILGNEEGRSAFTLCGESPQSLQFDCSFLAVEMCQSRGDPRRVGVASSLAEAVDADVAHLGASTGRQVSTTRSSSSGYQGYKSPPVLSLMPACNKWVYCCPPTRMRRGGA